MEGTVGWLVKGRNYIWSVQFSTVWSQRLTRTDLQARRILWYFVALAVFITDEIIRTTDGPNDHKAKPVLESLQTLVATSEGSSTASGWMPGLDAAVNELYGRLAEKKKAELSGWALNIVKELASTAPQRKQPSSSHRRC